MTEQEATDRIIDQYGAHIGRQTAQERIKGGIAVGLTVRTCFNILRLVLSVQTGQPEIFSRKESAEMMEAADQQPEVFAELTAPTGTRSRSGAVYYFPK